MSDEKQSTEDTQKQLLAAKRLLKIKNAHDSLVDFTELTMPHPEYPEDPEKSLYDTQYFHRALAKALQEIEAGRMNRLIVTFPPRHGKTELCSRRFPAWFMARDPRRHMIFATYNQPTSEKEGRKVREIFRKKEFKDVFPNFKLAQGSQSAGFLMTAEGGEMSFVGRGGSATGRGAHCLVIDDPLKDSAEARSDTVREELWEWYNDTISTRLMNKNSAIIIIQTRWHEDDLVGRLTDPNNVHYNEREAARWNIINIPALAEENDILGREPGQALWPEKFDEDFLESYRDRNPKGFASLYQQRPSPEDGDLFTRDMIQTYNRKDLPRNLHVYAVSDHAVGEKQENDRNCLMVFGVDEQDHIWILDCIWRRMASDETVEHMLAMIQKHQPLMWFALQDHISKSIGPFLKKRMREENTFCTIKEMSEKGDKVLKAQSIMGRMSMKMVHFPEEATWLEQAKNEMLKFPQGQHDDFVDTLSTIGRAMQSQAPASRPKQDDNSQAQPGTIQWLKESSRRRERRQRGAVRMRGM